MALPIVQHRNWQVLLSELLGEETKPSDYHSINQTEQYQAEPIQLTTTKIKTTVAAATKTRRRRRRRRRRRIR